MSPKPEHDDDGEDEEEIDEEQLADYCSMLDKLGNFPVSPCPTSAVVLMDAT